MVCPEEAAPGADSPLYGRLAQPRRTQPVGSFGVPPHGSSTHPKSACILRPLCDRASGGSEALKSQPRQQQLPAVLRSAVDGLEVLHGLMGEDRPAVVRRQQRGSVAVEPDKALHGGSDPGKRRCRRGLPSAARAPPRHPVAGAAGEVDVHRSPEPGDLTEPPRGRLLGGTGGPFVAEVADRQFRHLVSHRHNLARAAEADAPP